MTLCNSFQKNNLHAVMHSFVCVNPGHGTDLGEDLGSRISRVRFATGHMTSQATQISEHGDTMEKLWLVTDELLHQIILLLQETVTTDEQLSFQSELIPGSTIGKHLR